MLVSLLLVFGFNMARRHDQTPESRAASRLQGQQARDFTLQSLEGKTVRLSDFRGKAVLLNFWATWCEPCKLEMPWFVELQKQYGGQGFQVVGVAMDDADVADIAKFAKDMSVDYPILVGNESVRDAIGNDYGGVPFLPESFFINRDGKITDKVLGLKSKSDIEESIKKALGTGQVAQK